MAKNIKRILCTILSIIMVLTVIPMSAIVVNAEKKGEIVLPEGQLVVPKITLTSTPVIRLASKVGEYYLGNTIVPATESGIPMLSGGSTDAYYAGEQPAWPTVVFTSDKTLDENPSIMCEGNTSVKFSGPTKSGNTYTWTITEGSNVSAGSALKFVVGYKYTYTDSLTKKSITKSYNAYATSSAEYCSHPGGMYVYKIRTNTWHSDSYSQWAWRIMGKNVFGSFYNPTDTAGTWNHGIYKYSRNTASDGDPEFDTIANNANTAKGYGMVFYDPKRDSEGNKTSNTGLDQNRPISTIYMQEGYDLSAYNLRISTFEARNTTKFDHLIRSMMILPGEQTWDSSTTDNNDARLQLGLASIQSTEVQALDARCFNMKGVGYESALSDMDNGNKEAYYTVIMELGEYYDSSDEVNNTKSAVDLHIVTYDKEDLLACLNETLGEQGPTTPYAADSEIGINPNEQFYSEGWSAYKTALQNAQYVYNDADTDQQTIDAATKALQDAVAGLKVKAADYSAVNKAKSDVQGLNSTLYTDESWLALQNAVNKSPSGYSIFFQNTVDQFATNINAAIGNLEYRPADYTDVDSLVAKYNKLVESQYTADTWKTLKDAVAKVEYGITAERQSIVDGYRDAIQIAIKNLKYAPADYTKINEQVQRYNTVKAESNMYIVLLWRAVEAAYNSITWNKDWTFQAQIDTQAANLKSAIDNLEYDSADYTAVNDLLSQVNKLSASWYSPSTWGNLQNKISAVDFTLKKPQQSTVDGYASAIQTAIDGLVDVVGDYTNVNDAISRYNNLTRKYYTNESLTVADNAVKAVVEGRLARYQKEIDAYATNINNAIDSLVEFSADYTAVNTAVAKWNSLQNKNYYTEDSVLAVTNAIGEIDYTLKISKQTTVDAYAQKVETAYSGLTLKLADYTNLVKAINAAKVYTDKQEAYAFINNGYNFYTPESYKILTDAIGNVVYALDITHQSEVDGFAQAITAACGTLKYNDANYAKVNIALAKIPADIDEENLYDEDTVADVIIAQFDVDYELKTDKQDEVDAMAKAIEDAVAALKYKQADYSAIDALAQTWAAYPDKDKYTEASVKNVDNAFENVIRGYDVRKQSVVNAMAQTIQNAINNLGIDVADYSKVTVAVATATTAKSSPLYTAESVAAVDAAINAVVYNLKSAEQVRVDGFATDINNAVSALTFKKLDLGNYNAVVITIPADLSIYTDVSANAVRKALSSADDFILLKNDIRNQAEFNTLVNALSYAIGDLVKKTADYTALNEAIREANGLNASDYTNWSAVKSALDAVQTGLDITKQSQVNTMANNLNDALLALQYKDADYTEVDNAIKAVPADLTKYTEDSVAVLNNAINAVDRTLKVDKQGIVDGYAYVINDAIAKLKFVTGDYSALDALVASAKALKPENYKNYDEIYWPYISTYIVDTISVNRNYTVAEQDKIDAMTNTLTGYIGKLVLADADYTQANEVIALANERIKSGYYPDASIYELQSALSGIETGLDIEHQSQLDYEVAVVVDVMRTLKENPSDFSKINELYNTLLKADPNLYVNYADVFWTYVYPYYNVDVKAAKKTYKNISDQDKVDKMYEVMLGYQAMLKSVDAPVFIEKIGSTTDIIKKDSVNYVTGLKTGLTQKDFLENFVSYDNVIIEIQKSNSKVFLGTGSKIVVKDEKSKDVVEEYIIVVNGDINGDGKVDTFDFDMLNRIVEGTDVATGAYNEAADINNDGQVDVFDLSALSLVLAGLSDIQSVIKNINQLG